MIANYLQPAWFGVISPLKALRFLFRNKMLLKYCAAPIIIGFVIYTLAFIILSYVITQVGAEWFSLLYPALGVALRWILLIILIGSLALFLLVAITFLINLIAGPFHEQLSQKVEYIKMGRVSDQPFSWRQLAINSWRAIREESIKIILFGTAQYLSQLMLNVEELMSTRRQRHNPHI